MPKLALSLYGSLCALLCIFAISGAPVTATEKFALEPGWSPEEMADYVVTYHHEGKLDVGIGVTRDGGITPIRFVLEEMAWFWKQQRHKQWIVVVLEKWNPTDDERKTLAKKLTDYFFTAGFRRVLIRQGAGGLGYLVVSDALNPKDGEPATPR